MKISEAYVIYEDWLSYQEIAEKLDKTFMTTMPESFLPYPVEILEKALNLVANHYESIGDIERAEQIRKNMALYLVGYFFKDDDGKMIRKEDRDKVALLNMKKTLEMMFANEEFLEITLKNLKDSRAFWLNQRLSRIKQKDYYIEQF